MDAVIDVGFGDSGKGTVTAFLCQHIKENLKGKPIVYRYSGGHQAGHTVVHNGIRHVFSSFGSGTLLGVPTYWSEKCTFYPIAFMNELKVLIDKGIEPVIYVNSNCPVTTPYDVHHNKRQEKKNNHGSCGVGFGATLEREENYYSLVVKDLLFPSVLALKLEQIQKYYRYTDALKTLDDFVKICNVVVNAIKIVDDFSEIMRKYPDVVYEGSQGLLLDKDIGFFPHVTRANVGTKAIKEITDHLVNTYYVTRAYQTRHGNGPMTNESISHNIEKNPDETNVENYQGEFRRTLLDLDLVKYAIERDNCDWFAKSIVITCLDHVENDLRFTYKGEVFGFANEDEFIKSISDILNIKYIFISKSDEFINIERWRYNG